MNTMFFNAVSCFFVCAGLIIALILAINVIFHRQSMKIMNIVVGTYRIVGPLFRFVCLLYFWCPKR